MSQSKAERQVCLVNPQGLHMRPADQFVRTANDFTADVQVAKGQQDAVDGKSILSVLTLAAECGAQLTITADGDDAEAAVDALAALVEGGFGKESEDNAELASDSPREC